MIGACFDLDSGATVRVDRQPGAGVSIGGRASGAGVIPTTCAAQCCGPQTALREASMSPLNLNLNTVEPGFNST